MNAFDDFYRRSPKMNFTGYGKLAWKKAKERDQKIWKAALEWALDGPEDICEWNRCVIQSRIEKELDI